MLNLQTGNLHNLGGLNSRKAHGDEIINKKILRETKMDKEEKEAYKLNWDNGFNVIDLDE